MTTQVADEWVGCAICDTVSIYLFLMSLSVPLPPRASWLAFDGPVWDMYCTSRFFWGIGLGEVRVAPIHVTDSWRTLAVEL